MGRDKWLGAGSLLAIPSVERSNSRFGERPCLRGIRQRMLEGMQYFSPHECTWIHATVCTCMCMDTHTHTHGLKIKISLRKELMKSKGIATLSTTMGSPSILWATVLDWVKRRKWAQHQYSPFSAFDGSRKLTTSHSSHHASSPWWTAPPNCEQNQAPPSLSGICQMFCHSSEKSNKYSAHSHSDCCLILACLWKESGWNQVSLGHSWGLRVALKNSYQQQSFSSEIWQLLKQVRETGLKGLSVSSLVCPMIPCEPECPGERWKWRRC